MARDEANLSVTVITTITVPPLKRDERFRERASSTTSKVEVERNEGKEIMKCEGGNW